MHEPAVPDGGSTVPMPDAEDGIRIRPLAEADVPAVVAIESQSFATPWSEKTFHNLLGRANARLLAAVEGERVVGYAALWFAAGSGELGDLAVDPEARRRGIGTRLLSASIEQARSAGVREVFLEVRVGNAAARALYRRHGFIVVGRRPDYYTDPKEDALVMRRVLVAPAGGAL